MTKPEEYELASLRCGRRHSLGNVTLRDDVRLLTVKAAVGTPGPRWG
jgi:hypothetical protein